MIKTAHLFSGAGGGLLADLVLGHEPILAVEQSAICCASLQSRSDEGWFKNLHVYCGDVREFDFKPWAGKVDCISAGFPCQDISAAGSGEGISGKRSGLVSEVFRAIDVIRPGLVFLENSPHIRTKGRHIIIAELVARGYSWKDGKLAASDVGAAHDRWRWWCLAANSDGLRKLEQEGSIAEQWRRDCDGIEEVTDIDGERDDRGADGTRGDYSLRENPGRKKDSSRDKECLEDVADSDSQHGNVGGLHASSTPQHKASPLFECSETNSSHSPCIGLPEGSEFEGQFRPLLSDGCSLQQAPPAMFDRLQSAVQCGGLSEADAETIEAVAGYTGAYDWSPPDVGICGMVDGVAVPMDGNPKGKRIEAAGNGQVPLAAAAAWLILSGQIEG